MQDFYAMLGIVEREQREVAPVVVPACGHAPSDQYDNGCCQCDAHGEDLRVVESMMSGADPFPAYFSDADRGREFVGAYDRVRKLTLPQIKSLASRGQFKRKYFTYDQWREILADKQILEPPTKTIENANRS